MAEKQTLQRALERKGLDLEQLESELAARRQTGSVTGVLHRSVN